MSKDPTTPDVDKETQLDGKEKKDQQASSKTHPIRSLFSTIGILILVPVVAILLTAFVFQSYQVQGQSMENTLQNNDRLMVWKLPRTWARITGHQYVPKRGDIIIFGESGLSNYGDSQDTKELVKRVIGLPGDRVVYANGTYTIYNKAHPRGFDPDKTVAYGKSGTPLFSNTDGDCPNIDVKLGPQQLFVSGDHRGDSLDSRCFGPIQTSQVTGTLVARIYPDPKQF
jgi:signal peptidase I